MRSYCNRELRNARIDSTPATPFAAILFIIIINIKLLIIITINQINNEVSSIKNEEVGNTTALNMFRENHTGKTKKKLIDYT